MSVTMQLITHQGVILFAQVWLQRLCGTSTAQRGSAAAPASSRDHCLHSNGPTKWHSCPGCFTHIPSEVDIKAASLVLSSFGDIETMTPSLLEIASCLCSHSHNVSSFRKYPLLWKSSKRSAKETYLQISRINLVLPDAKVQPLCLPRRVSLTQAPSWCYRRNPMNGMHLKAPCSPEIAFPFHGKKRAIDWYEGDLGLLNIPNPFSTD